MAEKLLCVSVDLDGPGCYHAIHGLPEPDEAVRDAHYTRGLVRHLDLFDHLGIRSTLFAVGEDVERDACASVLREAHSAGHEIANHTWSHRYDFSRLDADGLAVEISRCSRAVEALIGRPTVGFRAPGYHIDGRVVGALVAHGYLYDASLLPSPAYYAAKLSVMARMSITGRQSRSIAGGPGMTLAPNRPYRMGPRYWIRGRGLPELPCTVVPGLRVPFIGTTLSLLGRAGAVAAARVVAMKRFVGLELHAIDLMDGLADDLTDLAHHQPDLKKSLDERRETFAAVLEVLLAAGFRSVTLERAAGILF